MRLRTIPDLPLVDGAREARRPTHWWLAYPFGVIVCIIGAGSIASAISSTLVTYSKSSVVGQVADGFAFLATLLTLAAWVRVKEGRAVSSLGFRGTGALRRFAAGLAIGSGLQTLMVLILLALGQYGPAAPPAHATAGLAALVPVVLLVVVWTVQSSTEETLMRGYFIQVGALQMPGWAAVLVPGLIFSGLHFTSVGLSQPIAIVNIVLFALFSGLIGLRQGSLWLACGVHTGWNWFQGNVFGLSVSGSMPLDVTLFRLGPAEAADPWLSGGTFGPEGSLVALMVWCVALALSYRYFRSAQPRAAAHA